MALKPTIYKATIDLADLNRDYYTQQQLTVARHPSETAERMMVRLLAWCLHADDHLEICKGLSDSDEPALWRKALHGEIEQWIDVGQPDPDRLRKAQGKSNEVWVYAFGKAANTWWQKQQAELCKLNKTRVMQLEWRAVEELASMSQRNMSLSVQISEQSVFVASEQASVQLEISILHPASN